MLDKTIATKNRDTRSLITNNSWYQKIREKKEEIPYEVPQSCETKCFSREVVMINPPLIHENFRNQKFSKNTKSYFTKFFGPLRQQFIRREIAIL